MRKGGLKDADVITISIDQRYQAGLVEIKKRKIPISEKNLGSYEIEELRLYFGSHISDIVRVTPKQKENIGADGRLDILGKKERYVLLKKQEDWYLTDEGDLSSANKLTKERFLSTIKDLLEE